ncbi:adaptin N terminal region-domain-containing protein [Crucibulum laeve]|uniref:Adaptin N terminal region-domain-containing protein n=1 Tax=Crucibulum laeve TaxID=68775 RepID=A0A5C3M6B0_9AGAR|nr:adaptin N terminal region-domain-containing protein [Crucibulum laeve]
MSGGQYLNSITENASRLGMRLQESFSEHTRDLTIARGASAAYLDTSDDKSKNIRKQLDSNSDREKLDAMKRLVALISKGRNVSEYFAQVVKNVASQNLEIRKLVYIYLLRYAEQEPDLALLSINTFQKDLTDSNPLIRAMALRVLSGIKVPMIGSIVVLAIKKCAADISPYVRKAAALAIPKCYELDSSHLPALIGIISTLLRDRSPLSIGSVAVAFEAVCPTRLDILHQQYRRLCKILVDVDEWGQVDLLNLLLRYARTMLPRPLVREDGVEELDTDVKLLLTSAEPVLQSRNPAVVLAAARVIYYAAPPSYLSKIVNPLLRLLTTSKEVERVVLVYLLAISKTTPSLFAPFYPRFLVRTDDMRQVKKDKIRLLLNVLNIDNYSAILRELIDYADDVEDSIVSEAIGALGKCARIIPEATQQCLTALITLIRSPHDAVVSSAVMVLKYLVQVQLSVAAPTGGSTSQSPLSIISHLARRIDDIKHAQARACVLWLVGQYAQSDEPTAGPEGIASWAPNVLRKIAKTFGQEASLVKLQIITLAAKLLVLCPVDRTLGLLTRYVFSLARYDLNYDVRDRAKMLSSLLAGVSPSGLANGEEPEERGGVVLRREQVRLVLFEGKSGIVDDEPSHLDDATAMLGSLGLVTGKPVPIDGVLPDWLENGVESSLRDSEDDALPQPVAPTALSSAQQQYRGKSMTPVVLTPTGTSRPNSRNESTSARGPWTDLDKFYEDAGDEDEDEDEEEESDESQESEEESEEDGNSEGDHPDPVASHQEVLNSSASDEEDSKEENEDEDSHLLDSGGWQTQTPP